mgnify:CR=1 FL=1
MRNTGRTADVISYTAISACEKGGYWWLISFSAAISACMKGGRWEQALSLLRKMSRAAMIANVISLTAARANSGSNGISLDADVMSFSAAISTCEKGMQWQRVAPLLSA